MSISRKEFLGLSALAALGAGCCSCRSGSPTTVAGIKLGVQMWSVNDIWKKDPAAAFRRLKSIGYDGVQSLAFWDLNWDELEKMLDGEGLQIVDMPFRMKHVETDAAFAKYLAFCQRFKINFVYEPWSRFVTGWEWKRHAEELRALQEKFAPYGIRVGYHNHREELNTYFDGRTSFEYFAAAGLDFELDVGHVTRAGGGPIGMLAQLKGRVPSIHAKPGGGNSIGCAEDATDWPTLMRAAAEAGVKWAIVECEARRNTYQDVEDAMQFLKNLKI